nr:hypothetical protein [Janibacter limosus]
MTTPIAAGGASRRGRPRPLAAGAATAALGVSAHPPTPDIPRT